MEVTDERKSGLSHKLRQNKIVKKLSKIKNIQLLAFVIIISVGLIIYSSVVSNRNKSTANVSNGTVSTVVMNEQEQRLANMLQSIKGAGKVKAMISQTDGKIVGVIVVAEGADDITVMLRLMDATQIALNIDQKIVEVYKMQK